MPSATNKSGIWTVEFSVTRVAMVLVDSSVWIEATRKTGRLDVKVALESLLDEYEATICSPVRLEVLGGLRKESRKEYEAYFSILPYVAAKEEDWSVACSRAWAMADRGFRVPWYDLMIATISLRLGCRVYSIDGHFELMEQQIGIRLYRPGYGGSYSPDI
jgi:predicted nucleic acid-binding protein